MGRNYQNMEIYHLSYNLALALYKATEHFPAHEQSNIISQIRRSATSMPLNIAEGSTKKSEKEFLAYLNYSYGSAKEIEVLLRLSKDLGYISSEEHRSLAQSLDAFNAKIFLFLRDLERNIGCNKTRFFQEYKYKGKTQQIKSNY